MIFNNCMIKQHLRIIKNTSSPTQVNEEFVNPIIFLISKFEDAYKSYC